jgi:hypothetical protein
MASRLTESAAILELVVSWIVTTALTFFIVIADERLMREERLERAWPPTSRDAAIVAFGVLALPIHFARTRGHFRNLRGLLGIPLGLVMGAVAVVVVAFLGGLILEGVFHILGLPTPEG